MLNLAHLEARRRGWPVDEPADVRTAIGRDAMHRVRRLYDCAVFEHLTKRRRYVVVVYFCHHQLRHMWHIVTSERADALE